MFVLVPKPFQPRGLARPKKEGGALDKVRRHIRILVDIGLEKCKT
jgi:hypothetical protein